MQVRVRGRAHADPLFRGVADLFDADPGGVHRIRIERIGRDGTPLPRGYRAPVERRDLTEVAAAPGADGARILLGGVHPVRERIVGGDVVDLLGGLIVPRAPRLAGVERHDGALIDAEQHPVAVRGIEPHLLRVVAARRALESRKRVSAVGRLVARRVNRVDHVGILRVHVHAAVVAALPVPDALIVPVHLAPRCPAIVTAEQAVVADHEYALRARVLRHGDVLTSIQARQPTAGHLSPGEPFVGRFV